MKKIKCTVKNYDWGKVGISSQVSQLGILGSHIENVKNIPYAEMWLGTHSSGPSTYVDSALPIQEKLPYLLKVLSIEKALSIQIHPKKELAEELFKTKPDIYPDSNHKPEMAICLTDFEALCGKRNEKEIIKILKDFPELKLQSKSRFKEIFTVSESVLQVVVSNLILKEEKTEIDNLILRLFKQHGIDSGILAPIVMNYIRLSEGGALIIYPNTPHAYISGELIECMACSDNVVRLGLTSKVKDLETLDTINIQNKYKILPKMSTYNPPLIDEFIVDVLEVKEDLFLEVLDKSILLVINGAGYFNAEYIFKGSAYYFEKTKMLMIKSTSNLKIVIARTKKI